MFEIEWNMAMDAIQKALITSIGYKYIIYTSLMTIFSEIILDDPFLSLIHSLRSFSFLSYLSPSS